MTRPVLVVGGGPTGLTAANLLGTAGVPVILVERHATTSDEAKAISIDDESLRTMQAAGLEDALAGVVTPGTGTRYFDRKGRPLLHARGPAPFRLGHPFKNPFAQPDLERALLAGLARFPHVDVRFGTELTALDEGTARLRGPGGDEDAEVSYVLGCDGGRSTVRELTGIRMSGRSHDDLWLVLDTLEDSRTERYAMHHGDPARPYVVVPGRDGRCRYEFSLHPGEAEPGDHPPFELTERLLAPHRTITPEQVERSVVYRFHGLTADRWRAGRCFLLGDAAHMMPPFAGQGLNSGIRDTANLSWKLAAVLKGRASDTLLDTYEREREPHAAATVGLSERLGRIVMTRDRRVAITRDLAVRALLLTRPGRAYLEEMRFRPPARFTAGFVAGAGGLAGTPVPQPRVFGAGYRLTRLDDVLGTGFAAVGVDVSAADWELLGAAFGDLGVRRIGVALGDRGPAPVPGGQAVTDADGALQTYFGGQGGRFVLIRPDRFVAAVFTPGQAAATRAALATYLTPESSGHAEKAGRA